MIPLQPMGPPQNRPPGFVGRGEARERAQFSPQAETEPSGLCFDDGVSRWCQRCLIGTVQHRHQRGAGRPGRAPPARQGRRGRAGAQSAARAGQARPPAAGPLSCPCSFAIYIGTVRRDLHRLRPQPPMPSGGLSRRRLRLGTRAPGPPVVPCAKKLYPNI